MIAKGGASATTHHIKRAEQDSNPWREFVALGTLDARIRLKHMGLSVCSKVKGGAVISTLALTGRVIAGAIT